MKNPKLKGAVASSKDEPVMGFRNVYGQEIHFAQTGNKDFPTLLFVHGTPDDWTRYKEFLLDDDLLQSFRMIAIDRPGFGKTPRGQIKDLKDQSRLISAFVKLVRNNKPIFSVGHSYGGAVVVQLQADDPSLFNGLVLLAAALDPAKEKANIWMRILDGSPFKYLLSKRHRLSNKELVSFGNDLEILSEEFRNITCPVWIMHGDRDTLVSVSNIEYARKKLSKTNHIEIKILPGAKHFITNERFREVKELLMKLLS
jgi:pimeloyl-ACP methyl ester carboxylesterase